MSRPHAEDPHFPTPTRPAGAPYVYPTDEAADILDAGGRPDQPAQNTDRELWRSEDGTDVVRLARNGDLFIGHGGTYIGMTPEQWQRAATAEPSSTAEAGGSWLRLDLVMALLRTSHAGSGAKVIEDMAAALEGYIETGESR